MVKLLQFTGNVILYKWDKKIKKVYGKLCKMWYNERVREGFCFVNKEGFL